MRLSLSVHLARSGQWTCRQCRVLRRPKTSRRTSSHQYSTNQASVRLPADPARTRFAPSPTGYLHLGSLRTALYNYLLAKRTGGQFILRIEDTDQKRTIPGAQQRLCDDLRWAGLDWDEGPEVGGPYGPYKQSERTSLYLDHAKQLLDTGHAYRCFCGQERLRELAEHKRKLGLPIEYDRTCASISAPESKERSARGEGHVIRLKVPDEYPRCTDLVYGKISGSSMKKQHGKDAYEDPILIKTDGMPTYHLANVVDDHHMKITHVIRAQEWLSSTPKHVVLYKAFGWEPPRFAHVGILQEKSGKKLSKRNGNMMDVSAFRDKLGDFPEPLSNFVALLGWSHNQPSDVMSMQQLKDAFDLKFTKGNTVVFLGKLWFLQQAHMQRYAAEDGAKYHIALEDLRNAIKSRISEAQLDVMLQGRNLDAYLRDIIRANSNRYSTANDFIERHFYLLGPVNLERDLKREESAKKLIDPQALRSAIPDLAEVVQGLHSVPASQWNAEALGAKLTELIKGGSGSLEASLNVPVAAQGSEVNKLKPDHFSELQSSNKPSKRVHFYMRWAIAEGKPGPPMNHLLSLLGRTVALERLDQAVALLKRSQS